MTVVERIEQASWRVWFAVHDHEGSASRGAPFDTGLQHGPEPHPELHARCRRCGRRWPEHDQTMGYCPEPE